MRQKFGLSIVLTMLGVLSQAQNESQMTIDIGDTAPKLYIKEWVKGTPIKKFEKGKVYVIEFWATWCMPCKAAMPHLSSLAERYRDSVTIIGVDIKENKNTSLERIRHFVDSMGRRIKYKVAIQDSNFMETDWIAAANPRDQGIPASFVINGEGLLAWIGQPKNLDKILPQILNNTWDIKNALDKRTTARYLRQLDDSLNDVLRSYRDDERIKPADFGRPDLALTAIKKIINDEPRLTYATFIVYNTFISLLKTNQQKALDYGRRVLVNPSYDGEPAHDMIIDAIETYGAKLKLSGEIYQLGADACQQEIEAITYPEIVDMGKLYHRMAAWYWKAKNKVKALNAERQAVRFLKNQEKSSKIKMAEYESDLRKYQSNLKQ